MSFGDDFSSTTFHNESSWGSSTVIQPPNFVLPASLGSIATGVAIGIYGIFNATSTQQTIFGILGYLVCIVIPISLLQYSVNSHMKRLANNPEEYNAYGGIELQAKMRKIVLIGLIAAAIPLYLFTTPIAEAAVI